MEARKTGLLRLMWVSLLIGMATLISTGIPARAQEALVLFENFESKFLDSTKWYGQESASSGVVILESGRQIKTEPIYIYKGLDLLNRAYANTASDTGSSGASTGLYFKDGSKIKTIQAKIQVKKIKMATCGSNLTTTSDSRARIGGTFFNTGTPTQGSYLNDVFAYIALLRESNSALPPNTLSIIGRVFVCNDANCNSTTLIDQVDLGTVTVNKKVKLRVTWDPDHDRFIFQKGKGTEFYVTYSVSDTNPPGAPNGGGKRLQVHHNRIPNCTTDPRPYGHVEAFFDEVYVNASAVP